MSFAFVMNHTMHSTIIKTSCISAVQIRNIMALFCKNTELILLIYD